MRYRTRIIGKLVAGWTIARPCIGNDMRYTATSRARPGETYRFSSMTAAERWCCAHDVSAEDFALAMEEDLCEESE